jgi:SAM-dependent methyltransferase
MLYENPELYDTLLPVSSSQLNFYLALARQHGGTILELACGSGQLAVPIAAQGASVIGLDNSPEMLTAARRRSLAAGVGVEFVEGDMRDFDLARRFPLIFIARNSLLHLSEPDEFAAFFSAVRRHLAPDGILAFDIFKPDLHWLTRPSGTRVEVMRVTSEPYGEITVEGTGDYDPISQVNRATWFISTSTQRDAWVLPLHLRSIFPQELRVLLTANGFRLTRRDGDYSGGAFTAMSRQQVCQCQSISHKPS